MSAWRTLALVLVMVLHHVPVWGQGSIWRARADIDVGVSVVQIAPANGSRLTLACSNRHASVTIRLGDTTVAINRGVALGPLSTLSFTGTSALHGISESGTAVIACSEEVR